MRTVDAKLESKRFDCRRELAGSKRPLTLVVIGKHIGRGNCQVTGAKTQWKVGHLKRAAKIGANAEHWIDHA